MPNKHYLKKRQCIHRHSINRSRPLYWPSLMQAGPTRCVMHGTNVTERVTNVRAIYAHYALVFTAIALHTRISRACGRNFSCARLFPCHRRKQLLTRRF
ncbi:hypothetical protein ALT785_380025 [Alteromonas infernus]